MGSSLSRQDLEDLYGDRNIKIEDDIFYKIINGITVTYCCVFVTFFAYGIYNSYLL